MNKKERLRELRKYNNNEKRMRNFNFNSLLLLIIIFGLGGIAYFLYDNGYFSEQKAVILVTPTATIPPNQISPPPTPTDRKILPRLEFTISAPDSAPWHTDIFDYAGE